MDRSFDFPNQNDRDGLREDAARPTADTHEVATRRAACTPHPTAAGSGWYHDVAIEQARHDAVEARCNPYA